MTFISFTAANQSFVRWQGLFHPAYKIDNYLHTFEGVIENVDIMSGIPDSKSLESAVENSTFASIRPSDDREKSARLQREKSSQESEVRGIARNTVLEFFNRQLTRENIDLLSE